VDSVPQFDFDGDRMISVYFLISEKHALLAPVLFEITQTGIKAFLISYDTIMNIYSHVYLEGGGSRIFRNEVTISQNTGIMTQKPTS
jgi:hypothetical protein